MDPEIATKKLSQLSSTLNIHSDSKNRLAQIFNTPTYSKDTLSHVQIQSDSRFEKVIQAIALDTQENKAVIDDLTAWSI